MFKCKYVPMAIELRLKTSRYISSVLTMPTNKTIVEMHAYICACASLSVIYACTYIGIALPMNLPRFIWMR